MSECQVYWLPAISHDRFVLDSGETQSQKNKTKTHQEKIRPGQRGTTPVSFSDTIGKVRLSLSRCEQAVRTPSYLPSLFFLLLILGRPHGARTWGQSPHSNPRSCQRTVGGNGRTKTHRHEKQRPVWSQTQDTKRLFFHTQLVPVYR